MDVDLVGLDRTDSSGRIWIVPNHVASIEPDPIHPTERSVLRLSSGHQFTVIGRTEEISKKLRGSVGGLLGMHAQIELAPSDAGPVPRR